MDFAGFNLENEAILVLVILAVDDLAVLDFPLREFRHIERHDTDRDQPLVMGAELRRTAIQRPRAAI